MTKFEFTKKVMFGASLVAALAACAGEDVEPEVEVTEEEIIGGFPANSPKLNAVGSLSDIDFGPFCSATLISPTLVLTAQHCVDWTAPFFTTFDIGPNAFAPVRKVPVAGFAWDDTVPLSDVALVHLAEPVTDVTPFAYAELTPDKIGRRFVGIGYGIQDANGTFGTRRAGSMRFNALGGSLWVAIYPTFEEFLEVGAPTYYPEFDPTNPDDVLILQDIYLNGFPLMPSEAWFGNGPGDAQVWLGDSGGPITLNIDGKNTVFGVASWVLAYQGAALPQFDGAAYWAVDALTLDMIDYETNCALIPRDGTCDGDTAIRCADKDEGGYYPVNTNCADIGMICGFDAEAGEIGCIDPCSHDTCTEGAILSPECGSCEAQICAADPFCCEVAWDSLCVLETETVCGLECPASCPHDVCTVGEKLDTECGTCEATVCGVDSYCCEVEWDGICVDEAQELCGASCGIELTAPAIQAIEKARTPLRQL